MDWIQEQNMADANGNGSVQYDPPPPYSLMEEVGSPNTAPNTHHWPNTRRSWISKLPFYRWLQQRKKARIENLVDAAHTRTIAVTSAIAAAIETVTAAVESAGGTPSDAQEAAKCTSEAIIAILDAVLSVPPRVFARQAVVDWYTVLVAKLVTTRAADVAGGMPIPRAMSISNIVASILYGRTYVLLPYDRSFNTKEMASSFGLLTTPLQYVPAASAPAIAIALNKAYTCAVRGLIEAPVHARPGVATQYSNYAKNVAANYRH